MSIVTTEVTYDAKSLTRRLERKNSKESLAFALAKIWDMSIEHEQGIPPEKLQCVMNRVIWGTK